MKSVNRAAKVRKSKGVKGASFTQKPTSQKPHFVYLQSPQKHSHNQFKLGIYLHPQKK